MNTKKVINLVGTTPRPGDDDKFNRWYNDHIYSLMKFQRLEGATRWRRIGEDASYPKYLCIYEFPTPEDFAAYDKSPEFIKAEEERKKFWGGDGFDLNWRRQYERLGTWKR